MASSAISMRFYVIFNGKPYESLPGAIPRDSESGPYLYKQFDFPMIKW